MIMKQYFYWTDKNPLLYLLMIFTKKEFGDAGNKIVIEEYLVGEEASVFALTDGSQFVVLSTAQDHKRIFDGDKGKNTGGMGAYAPAPLVTPELLEKIEKKVNIIIEDYYRTKKFKETTICCIARLSPNKRVGDLIQAVAVVKKQIPDVNCIVIGDGDEREKLQSMIENLQLSDSVKLLGRIDKNEDVWKKLKSSHIFCLPSALEGFGIVILEAMACGIPYVCSDIPPLKEVTNNGQGGLLFKVGDSKDLAEKMLSLLKDLKMFV